MRKTIVLTYTAAALLMAAAVALNSHGHDTYEYHMAAAGDSPTFMMLAYHHPLLESWERAADVAWLLALGVLIAGIKLSAGEPPPPHRVSMLGLHAVAPRHVVREAPPAQSAVVINAHADAARPLSLHGEDGLTRLERIIRGY